MLRAVTSGFIPGDDWADEYEAMTAGGDGYFRTLVEYLAHFSGRFAVPVTAFGPPGTAWERDRAMLSAALGLADGAGPGDTARFTPAESARPVAGVVYFATPGAIAVRTPGGFYRFLRGFGHPMVAAHQLFTGGLRHQRTNRRDQGLGVLARPSAQPDVVTRNRTENRNEHSQVSGRDNDRLRPHRRGRPRGDGRRTAAHRCRSRCLNPGPTATAS